MRIDPSRNRRRDIPPLADSREKILYKIRESLQTTISTSKLFYLPWIKKKKKKNRSRLFPFERNFPPERQKATVRSRVSGQTVEPDWRVSLSNGSTLPPLLPGRESRKQDSRDSPSRSDRRSPRWIPSPWKRNSWTWSREASRCRWPAPGETLADTCASSSISSGKKSSDRTLGQTVSAQSPCSQ